MAEVSLVSPLARELYFNKQVDQASVGEVTQKIIEINKNDEYLIDFYKIHGLIYNPKPIEIYIDSYGGSVYQIFGLINIIEKSKTKVRTIVTGTAMSAGFLMLIAGHERWAYPSSTIMCHQLSSWAFGKLKDMEDDVEECRRLQQMIESFILKRTKISKSQLENNKSKKEDWFITSRQALTLGIVDKIV